MKGQLFSIAVLVAGAGNANTAEFEPPIRLKAGAAAIRAESPGFAAPCWAGIKGKPHLLVGQFNLGKIQIFEYLGGERFAPGKWLEAEGSVAEVPGVWRCTSSTPQLVDLDGDGNDDILSGSYSREELPLAGLFQVLYGKSDGNFRKAEVLNGTDGEPLVIPLNGRPDTENICTRPFAVDWNGDGDLDLVVGNFSGTFYCFKGEGKGRFHPEPQSIMVENDPLCIEDGHSDPFVIDWDGDGAIDVLSGSSRGGVQWAKNHAGKGKAPELGGFEWLIEPTADLFENGRLFVREDDLMGPGGSTRVWVADINGDGKLDLLVGDSAFLRAPGEGLSEADVERKFAEWQKAYREIVGDNLHSDDEAKRKKAFDDHQKLYEQRAAFVCEESTGFVWLYLRK